MASHKVNGLHVVLQMKEKVQVLTWAAENQAPTQRTAEGMFPAD